MYNTMTSTNDTRERVIRGNAWEYIICIYDIEVLVPDCIIEYYVTSSRPHARSRKSMVVLRKPGDIAWV